MAKKELYYEDVNVGDEIPPLVEAPIEKLQLVKYAGASGDFNPMHSVDDFAKAAGQPSVFAHGMLIMGFLGQFVTTWVPNRALRKLGVRLGSITWPGDIITCKGKVTNKRQQDGLNYVDCEIWAENQRGERPITGTATLVLPSRA